MSSVVIRPFQEEDWRETWPIFREIVAKRDTYAYPPDISENRARELWLGSMPGPAQAVVAVDDDGAVLGTAKMGPNQMGPGAHVATASFMVDPARRRHGVGRALGEYVVEWAREHGFRGIQFNAVVSSNRPAVALWQSLGFEIVGTAPEAFHHANGDYVDLHVMYRRV